uniref:ADAMTS like 1 n=1 Tax=Gouania willdenowi TaxID=441366 RepID=A0A8C5I8H8_GOUWI
MMRLISSNFQSSRTARSEDDRDTLWDAWGSWSECSRTCGGGASYSLRRCLSSKICEGQNIKYRTCSNVDCPPDVGDFRAQQCSAHADVRYQGHYHEWLPVYNDPENPCTLKCKARSSGLVVELAPKVLDGTRCYTESLDMCISGACQIVGCDHELGSTAKEDSCGVCNGDGSSCRLVRGHYKTQHASGKTEDTVVTIPYKSRHVRLVLKGPDHLYVESKTLQGLKGEVVFDKAGQYHLENTSLDYQKLSDKEVLRITGPLGADFTVKVQFSTGADSVIQYIYYQPIIHRWRETDFFPCSVTCGGGYQLTSAECFDLRTGHVVVDQYCHYYPENVKPKPKLQECNMEPCLDSDGYKQIMPYDLYHPLPRWENSPWTACSTSCGGGIQSRSVSCVEEDMQGTITPTDEWKCLYASKTAILQPCNTFDCPTWLAQEWSPCTVTCGQGLSYRVVLCIDHRGIHTGGCNPTTKPHIKEECLVPVPCFKPMDALPVEAKPVWSKQAIELEEEEEVTVTEEPTFVPGPWQACSRTCGAGIQRRTIKCQVLLSFSQTVADLPDDECDGVKPASSQPCYRTPCSGGKVQEEDDKEDTEEGEEEDGRTSQREELHDWEYEGFTECSQSCGGGVQEAVVICLNKQTRETADQSLCVSGRRPPQLLQACKSQPCPPRWETGNWTSCSATCGVGLMTRTVACTHRPSPDTNHTAVLRDVDCHSPKPSPVQACNRFDCPPTWQTLDWGQCSRSCGGGGVQRRRVLCKQRLADGSILELPDTFCSSQSTAKQQACGSQECPPQWVTTDWTQCSVSCGSGVQTLQAVCRKLGENGHYWTLSHLCILSYSIPDSIKPDPTILAHRNVYIQWKKGKKVHLIVGGFAYLLPWTTVVLRCPTRHFRKGHIQWLKEGKPLVSVPHLFITTPGYVKIQQVRAADAGVYTCIAGKAREHFVLQIIGSKRKLSVPEPQLLANGRQTLRMPDVTTARERFHELPVIFNRYDNIVEQLLKLQATVSDKKTITNNFHSSDKNRLTLEDSTPFLLVADTHRLDEVMNNLSEGLGGPPGVQVIAQLLSELTVRQGESNESTHHPAESAELSTHKPNIKSQTSRLRSPIIIQRKEKVATTPQSDMVISLGNPILLQKPVDTLVLKCLTIGHRKPSLTWMKNGKQLHFSSRIQLLPSGSLQIQSPSKGDEGLYTCTARNALGSTSLSSWLQIKDKLASAYFLTELGVYVCILYIYSIYIGRTHCPKMNSSITSIPVKNHSVIFNNMQNLKNEKYTLTVLPTCIRWRVDAWSPCSATCGGGSQTRIIRCIKSSEGESKEVVSEQCHPTGRKPSSNRACNVMPCVRWGATSWGPCHGQCVGPSLATQHRHVYCQDTNGTKVLYRMCVGLQRPSSLKNCSTDTCSLQWRVGPWTQCTASCGRHGFQSRLVTCVHQRTAKAIREHQCMWRPRPPSWQRCNILSCGRGECRDSTRYCEKVRQLELCPLPQFKNRCCHSCQNT